MARPERNNVDYFPFLCEDGKKMFFLEETYGNDGFATFVKLLRELAKTDYHYLNLSKKTTIMFLSAKCKVSVETLESIINDLVDLEKFDKVLWGENKVIWCQDFVDSIQDAYGKRKNKCITYDGLLLLLVSLGVRKPINLQSKGVIKPQSKVEDSIEEEINPKKKPIKKVFISPTKVEFMQYAKSQLLDDIYQKSKKKLEWKWNAWNTDEWKDGNGKQISNWKSKLLHNLNYITQ